MTNSPSARSLIETIGRCGATHRCVSQSSRDSSFQAPVIGAMSSPITISSASTGESRWATVPRRWSVPFAPGGTVSTPAAASTVAMSASATVQRTHAATGSKGTSGEV